jgi:hypothetical protein
MEQNMKKLYLLLLLLFLTATLNAAKSISIDLSKQRLYAKENGRIVFSGAISSGNSRHNTPTGTFRILEKDRFHISSKYPEPHGGAKMHYMHRLTKGGIAIHAGYLPGYPASHGCIRVSSATAKKLWRWSRTGIRVHVYGNASNFRYVKKRAKKRDIAKKRYVKKKHYAKRAHLKKRRHYTKKHYVKRKRVARKAKKSYKHYVKSRRYKYEVVEIYDSW